ncbi:uncharacterized protein LOC125950080 isoform X1 [Anopheles darlingi]|uniref:uncharacterized protein LOC125950080 isoform X1 n=1 Tax=Anopheles darlingi TaxID=43151 RepID=UPI00210039E8|nr:uncharacterized protein LOC125950080 isoform X1 [Anopheles darlingi]XP_049533649.1 uncharacterized protein LOC125950080 isoform X1 [Anopheles darlingi]
MHTRHQRWMRQRTHHRLFMVTVALCIIGLEGARMVLARAQQTKDSDQRQRMPTDPDRAATPGSVNGTTTDLGPLLASDRQRRLIPYMQYYVTSTPGAPPAARGGGGADYQHHHNHQQAPQPSSPAPAFNQLYNYRPINVPSPAAFGPKQQQQQQQPSGKPVLVAAYRPQEDPSYDFQSQRPPLLVPRKQYYATVSGAQQQQQTKLVPATGGLKSLPFTYDYGSSSSINQHQQQQQHRGHQNPVKVASSYAILTSGSGDHGPADEVYERPKYAVIPRDRDREYDAGGPRFAVLPATKLYGGAVEVHTKSQPHHENEAEPPPQHTAAKYFLSTVPTDLAPSRKPSLYQAVPVVYKKHRINPFLPSNTIPGPFTPMATSHSSGAEDGANQIVSHQEEQLSAYVVKGHSTVAPSIVEYQQGETAGHQSPYVLVKTVPKYYYEKPRIAVVSSTVAPQPFPAVYYHHKEKPSKQQYSNNTGYTRPRVPVPAAEQPLNNPYYNVGHFYKFQEQPTPTKLPSAAPPPPRQHLTETTLTQHPVKHLVSETVSKPPQAQGHAGQYFLGANYKVFKVPAAKVPQHQHYHHQQQPYYTGHEQPSYQPQFIQHVTSTPSTPTIVYSTTAAPPPPSPSTTLAPAIVHETPSYPVVYHHHHHPQYQAKHMPGNRTEYTNRQRFYPPSMRHPSQHKPRPIPLAPLPEPGEPEAEVGLVAGGTSGSLSDLLKNLQDNNLLPKTLTPDNIDNSIRTLVKILNNLKANGRYQATSSVRPDPSDEVVYERPGNYTQAPQDERYVEADPYHHGPPMLINKIVTPGPNTGKPGIDYPALAEIPETSFSCKEQRYKGFFGDPETNCQVWHYCDLNGGKASFLCPNGTIFSQVALTCDWWFNVKCSTTAQLYVLNERLYKYILPFTPKFPEDYSGPLVDKYLALKFQEMEEKMKLQRAKSAKQGTEPIANTDPDNDEVNGNRLEDNDERYNQNQPYPVKYVTTEAIPERVSDASKPAEETSSAVVTLEDIDAELQRGNAGVASSTTTGGTPVVEMTSEEAEREEEETTHHRPTTGPTLIITTEDPPGDPYHEMMMMTMMGGPEGRAEDDHYANVVSTEKPPGAAALLPTAAPVVLSKIRRIEVKNDGTSGHLIRTPNYERRRRK